MKNKYVSLLLAVLLSLGILPFGMIPALALPERRDVTVKGSIFTNTGSTTDLSVILDFDWLTKGDNTLFNADLAAFAAIASEEAYFRDKDKGTDSENKVLIRGSEDYDLTSFLSSFGFDNVKRIETYDKQSTDIDKNDSATFLAGHRLTDGKDVFVFVFRGAYSSGEWLSMFDVGDPAAIDLHPNWTEPKNLKSIDVAANAASRKIGEYIRENGKEDAEDVILLTGHSRGGAIANVVGAAFEKARETKSFTYTFSSPKTTLSSDASTYRTVFNVVNADDFYEDFLPFRNESFARFGTDLTESFSGSDALKNRLKEFGAAEEYTCMSAADREKYRTLFAESFPGRTDLFQTETQTLLFDDAAGAQSKFDACNTVISGFKLDDLCKAELDGSKVILTTAKASLLKSYSMVLAYGTPDMVDYVRTLFPTDEIAELLYRDLADMTNAHLLLKSLVLSESFGTAASGTEPTPETTTAPATESVPETTTAPATASPMTDNPATGEKSDLLLCCVLLPLSAAGMIARLCLTGKKRKTE